MPKRLITYESLLDQLTEDQLTFFLDYLNAASDELAGPHSHIRNLIRDLLIANWMLHQVDVGPDNPLDSLDWAIETTVPLATGDPLLLDGAIQILAMFADANGFAMPPGTNQSRKEAKRGHTKRR